MGHWQVELYIQYCHLLGTRVCYCATLADRVRVLLQSLSVLQPRPFKVKSINTVSRHLSIVGFYSHHRGRSIRGGVGWDMWHGMPHAQDTRRGSKRSQESNFALTYKLLGANSCAPNTIYNCERGSCPCAAVAYHWSLQFVAISDQQAQGTKRNTSYSSPL